MSFASSGAAAAAAAANTTTSATATATGGDGCNAHANPASPPTSVAMSVAGCLDLDAAAVAEETTMAEVDDAFAMLLSLGTLLFFAVSPCLAQPIGFIYKITLLHVPTTLLPGESEQERGKVAVSTVSRMIQNLAAAPEDPKLRSIRVSNKAFQSKVAAVPGGAELLVAAGYTYRNCSATNSNSTSSSHSGVVDQGNGEAEGELFLVHDMNVEGRGKLHYTLSR